MSRRLLLLEEGGGPVSIIQRPKGIWLPNNNTDFIELSTYTNNSTFYDVGWTTTKSVSQTLSTVTIPQVSSIAYDMDEYAFGWILKYHQEIAYLTTVAENKRPLYQDAICMYFANKINSGYHKYTEVPSLVADSFGFVKVTSMLEQMSGGTYKNSIYANTSTFPLNITMSVPSLTVSGNNVTKITNMIITFKTGGASSTYMASAEYANVDYNNSTFDIKAEVFAVKKSAGFMPYSEDFYNY